MSNNVEHERQVAIIMSMQSQDFNVVTCHFCEAVILVSRKNTPKKCHSCGDNLDGEEPDFIY